MSGRLMREKAEADQGHRSPGDRERQPRLQHADRRRPAPARRGRRGGPPRPAARPGVPGDAGSGLIASTAMRYVSVGRRFAAVLIDGVMLGIMSGPFAEIDRGPGYFRIELERWAPAVAGPDRDRLLPPPGRGGGRDHRQVRHGDPRGEGGRIQARLDERVHPQHRADRGRVPVLPAVPGRRDRGLELAEHASAVGRPMGEHGRGHEGVAGRERNGHVSAADRRRGTVGLDPAEPRARRRRCLRPRRCLRRPGADAERYHWLSVGLQRLACPCSRRPRPGTWCPAPRPA